MFFSALLILGLQFHSSINLDIFGTIINFLTSLINSIFRPSSKVTANTTISTNITTASTHLATSTATSTTSIAATSSGINNSQTNPYVNQSQSGQNSYLAQLAVCALAGVSPFQCQSYCANIPNHCGSSSSGGTGGQGYGGQSSYNQGNVTIGSYSFSRAALNATVITANPINLTQILNISKFRSCSGHDFSGYSFNGTLESGRSMKHYINIPQSLRFAGHKVQIFAAANGTIIFDNKTLDYPNGDQVVIKASSDPIIGVEIFHIDLLPGITIGTAVKAGQLIGYKNASEYSGFDIAYGPLNPYYPCGGRCGTPMAGIWDSIFNHMTAQVLTQYAAVGINQSNVIFSKSARDSLPCNYPNETGFGSSGIGSPYANQPWNVVNVTISH